MLSNTIAIHILMGTLATSSVTSNLTNPIDDYYDAFESNPQKIESLPDLGAFKRPYYSKYLSNMMMEDYEYYGSLDIERRKDGLRRLFEDQLSFGDIMKAREVLAIAIREFPNEKRFSLANKIIAPPKFISSNESESEGIRETIAFLKNIGNELEKKWIAVSKGELLRVSESYKELAESYKGTDVFVVQVL